MKKILYMDPENKEELNEEEINVAEESDLNQNCKE